MATVKNNERVIEEGVIIVLGEHNEPVAMVRKSFDNGGKVEMYKLEMMGFSDIKPFLSVLAQPPLLISGGHGGSANFGQGGGGSGHGYVGTIDRGGAGPNGPGGGGSGEQGH